MDAGMATGTHHYTTGQDTTGQEWNGTMEQAEYKRQPPNLHAGAEIQHVDV